MSDPERPSPADDCLIQHPHVHSSGAEHPPASRPSRADVLAAWAADTLDVQDTGPEDWADLDAALAAAGYRIVPDPPADLAPLIDRLRKRGRWVVTKRVPLFPQMDEEEWRPDEDCAAAADALAASVSIEDANRVLAEERAAAEARITELTDGIRAHREEVRNGDGPFPDVDLWALLGEDPS